MKLKSEDSFFKRFEEPVPGPVDHAEITGLDQAIALNPFPGFGGKAINDRIEPSGGCML